MTRHDAGLSATARRGWERLPPLGSLALLIATLIGLYVCYLLALPFLAPLTWALAVAVLAAPLHRRIERRLRNPNLSAAASVALLALVVVLPLTMVGQQLLGEVIEGAAAVQRQFASGDLQRTIESHPLVARAAALIQREIDPASIFGNVASWLTNFGASVVRGSLAQVISVLLTFYLLFYFLRDRRDVLRQLKVLSPLTVHETERLFGRVSDTIHAIVFGTVVTAALQGALGGAMFWLLGLPNALFWGVVMALLAVVPVLGTFVIWLPAAAYLALTGEWGKAAILTAWGGIVIAGVDNVLYPILAGGRLQLHTIPMFISIVGGITLFGAPGLVLGPLAITITLALLEVWRGRIAADRKDGVEPH